MRDSQRSPKSRYDSADGRNFHLRRRIPNKIDFAIAYSPPHGHPLLINRYPRPLPLHRLQLLFLEEPLKTLLRVPSRLADNSQSPAFGRFRNQPIEIRYIVRYEPHARRVRRILFWQSDDSLDQGDGLERRPTSAARHSAGSAIRSHNVLRMEFLATSGGVNFNAQSPGIRCQPKKTRVKGKVCTRRFGASCQRGD